MVHDHRASDTCAVHDTTELVDYIHAGLHIAVLGEVALAKGRTMRRAGYVVARRWQLSAPHNRVGVRFRFTNRRRSGIQDVPSCYELSGLAERRVDNGGNSLVHRGVIHLW